MSHQLTFADSEFSTKRRHEAAPGTAGTEVAVVLKIGGAA